MTQYTIYATAANTVGNIVTVNSVGNMFSGLPIVFSGNTFGNITAGATYYIGAVIPGYPTSTITLSSLPGGAVYAVSNAAGNMTGIFSQGGQQIINTVPPGESLTTAFTAVNVNFDQLFAAGPVNSNIQIANNTVLTTNTNGNINLVPNGIGAVVINSSMVPDTANVRNLGSATNRFGTIYAQYYNMSGNLSPNNISTGNIVVTGTITGPTIITNTIQSDDSSFVTVNDGLNVEDMLTVAGNISATGNVTANAFIGDGSQLLNIPVGNNGAVQVAWLGKFSNQGGTPGDTYSTLQFDSNGMPTLDGTTAYQQRVDYSPYLQVLAPRVESTDFGIVAGPAIQITGYVDNVFYNTPRSAYMSVQDQANATQQWDFGILGNGSNAFSIQDRTGNQVWSFGTDGNINIPGLAFNINYANSESATLSPSVGNSGAVQFNWQGSLSNQGGTPGDTYSTMQFDSDGLLNVNGTTAYQPRVDYTPYMTVNTPRVESTDFNVVAGPGITVVGYDDSYNIPRSAYLSVQDQATTTQQWDFGILGNGSNAFSIRNRTASTIPLVISTDGTVTASTIITNDISSDDSSFVTIQDGLNVVGDIETRGNITADYFLGNGSQLTGLSTSSISNGTSNVAIPTANGNVSITAAGTNTWTFGTTGNLSAPGNVSASGNVTGNFILGNIAFANGIPATYGNSNVANYLPTFSGNLTAGNVSATGNVTGGNILTAGNVSATGNVSGNFFIGNGSQLTGLPATYGNANVVANLAALGSNPISSTGNITTTANISGNFFIGNGSQLTGIAASYGNANVATFLAAYGSNAISTTGNITAGNFVGNGAALTNVTISLAGNIVGTQANVTLVAGSYSYTFDNTGNFTLPANSDILMTGVNSVLSAGGTTLLGGATQAVGSYSTLGVSYPGAGTQFGMTLRPVADNTTAIQFLNAAGNSIGNIKQTSSTVKFVGDGSELTGVATQVTGSWTVPTGNSTQSFTVSPSETYYMWVDCNIPNGILVWNATATVTNTNVPVVGAQYAWVYTGGGTPIDFTSIPNQFIGTSNTIVRSSVGPSATTNRFDFGINNTSGGNVTVRYGWTAIS